MKRIVFSAAVLSLAVAGIGQAQAAPSVVKITGGGQTLVPESGGAGDTVGFNAQVDGDGVAKGQFQYVERNGAGNGTNQQVLHGTVECAVVLSRTAEGGMAAFGGTLRNGDVFRVDVTDAGQGKEAMDMILLRTFPKADRPARTGGNVCDEDAPDEDETFPLSRGNVKIHQEKGGASAQGGKGGRG